MYDKKKLFQVRDRNRALLAREEEERKKRSRMLARQDWQQIKHSMPDIGPHGRATEMARRGYNRARLEGIERGRRTMALAEKERLGRVVAKKKLPLSRLSKVMQKTRAESSGSKKKRKE